MDIFHFEGLFTSANLIAFATLAFLEIILGIDNIVFISILTGKLPKEKQKSARFLGLAMALLARVLLLLAIQWVMGLTVELFTVMGKGFSGKDIILLVGGLFLIGKATFEIHEKIEVHHDSHKENKNKAVSFASIIMQIMLLDMVFSLDSVITAVGMVQDIRIMIVAVLVAVAVMMIFASSVSTFIERHPTMKVLALSFLLMIGVMLLIEGLGQHVNKGYIYFAMAFSFLVELVNLRVIMKLRHVTPNQ